MLPYYFCFFFIYFFFQAEDGIRDLVRSRGLGDVYKRQEYMNKSFLNFVKCAKLQKLGIGSSSNFYWFKRDKKMYLSLIHI